MDNLLKNSAWEGIITLPLGRRSSKPRNNGLTMVMDKGLGIKETRDLLEIAGDYIDFLKLGFGTSAFYTGDLLKEKIQLAHAYDVEVYPGGTFLEVAFYQGRAANFLDRAKELGFNYVEVSDGTINLNADQRKELIAMSLTRGLKVLTEIGKKDKKARIRLENLVQQVEEDLENGAYKVIMEGREGGQGIGLYDENGKLIENKYEEFTSKLFNVEDIIWEAPLTNQQFEFISKMGSDVNLGNIAYTEVLALEALRTGLRGDTFNLVIASADDKGMEIPPVLKSFVSAWNIN